MPKYLAFLRQQTESRRILFAGPVTDGSDLLGLAVLEAASAEEASAIANANPGVESGHFLVELHPCLFPALDDVQVEY